MKDSDWATQREKFVERLKVELLQDSIKHSGLSARAFAREILIRDERTIRRWLAGDSPIPEPVVHFLKQRAKLKGCIHHRDGNPRNNALSNLEIRPEKLP